MTTGKKYDYRVVQYDAFWKAEILRRATSKKTVVSKSQDGFATESDAQEWAQRELKSLLDTVREHNKHRSSQRE
jgi:hypothetical protein